MRDDGYTATEALAALAIVGLAIGGLTAGLQVIGRAQSAAAATLSVSDANRAANQRLALLMAKGAPYRSDDADNLRGDPESLSFACGPARCQAAVDGSSLVLTDRDGVRQSINLKPSVRLRFIYGGSLGVSDTWPPPPAPPPGPSWQGLQYVAIADTSAAQAAPLILARLWTQQAANCDFDAISQDCRPKSP